MVGDGCARFVPTLVSSVGVDDTKNEGAKGAEVGRRVPARRPFQAHKRSMFWYNYAVIWKIEERLPCLSSCVWCCDPFSTCIGDMPGDRPGPFPHRKVETSTPVCATA